MASAGGSSAFRGSPPAVYLGTGNVCVASDRYTIREVIGEGGMGIVYRAYDEGLRRDIALKVVRDADDWLVERFLREREITATLDHPVFVRVLSMGCITHEEQSLPFYTMPLIRGKTLERILSARHRTDAVEEPLRREFTLDRLSLFLRQLCLALQSAHDKRIVHRDIKPSNILVGPYGEVYLTDLGLAKYLMPASKESGIFTLHVMEELSKAHELDLTNGDILGTPYYMAPEQALSPRTIDHRVDIFGLGAILYFILVGGPPRYLEPPLSFASLEARKAGILKQLAVFVPCGESVSSLLLKPPEAIPPPARALVEEYEQIQGCQDGSGYDRLRLIMRDRKLIPPTEVLKEIHRCFEVAGIPAPPPDPIVPTLEAICMKALASRPEDRYPSCRALWHALHAQSAEQKGTRRRQALFGKTPPDSGSVRVRTRS